METDEEPIFGNLVYLGLVLLLFLGYITWKVYEALVVENDPSRLFVTNGGGDYCFLGFLAVFFLFLVFFAIQVSNCVLPRTSPNRWSISPGPSGEGPASIHWPALFGKNIPLRSIAAGTGMVIAVVAFALSGSVPLTLICIGCVLASYWLAWFFEPDGETRWLLFFVIPLCITLLFAVTGYVLLVPGLSDVSGIQVTGLYSRPYFWITFHGVLIIVAPVIVIFFVVWAWHNGVPFRKKPEVEGLEDYYEDDLNLPLPYERVFEICRDTVKRLPDYQIDGFDPDDGLLDVTVLPGKGRSSRIFIIIERSGTGDTTGVTIKASSPDPPPADAPLQVSGVNKKYVQTLASYIRSEVKRQSR